MIEPIISQNIRCRVPDHFTVKEGSIVDDYCYFSTRIEIGRFSHIANNVSVAGGAAHLFHLGDFSAVSSGVRIWCSSDDFNCDMAALPPAGIHLDRHTIQGDVCMQELTILGCNSVVMPNNYFPQGVAIGALSFVPAGFPFEEWSLYAGVPIRFIRKRDKEEIRKQKDQLLRQVEASSG